MPSIDAIATDEAPVVKKTLPTKRFKNQPNIDEALEICNHLGLEVKERPAKSKWFSDAYPEYFTYNPDGRKLNYKAQTVTP